MMPKRPKLTYHRIAEPIPGQMRSPEEKLTKRPESVILANQLKFGIRDTASAITNDPSVRDNLADLRNGLLDIVTTGNQDQNREFRKIIEDFSLLGFAAGYAETQGEIARQGQTEGHIAFALVLLFVDASQGLDNRFGLADYSLQAGYIVFRSGPTSVTRLLSTARDGRRMLLADR